MGPARLRRDSGRAHGHRKELPRPFRAFARGERIAGVARLLAIALLRVPHSAAYVRGARRLAPFHLHLRHAGGQEPARRNGDDPHTRHPAVGADPGLSVVHRDFLPRPFPWQHAGRGTRGGLRHLHEPGLEYGLLLLSVAAHRASRFGGGRARLPPHRLAEILAARSAVCDAGPDLEHDDVNVGRVVLRRRLGGDHRRRHHHHLARRRLLHRQGE
jgi:hypothetical protein